MLFLDGRHKPKTLTLTYSHVARNNMRPYNLGLSKPTGSRQESACVSVSPSVNGRRKGRRLSSPLLPPSPSLPGPSGGDHAPTDSGDLAEKIRDGEAKLSYVVSAALRDPGWLRRSGATNGPAPRPADRRDGSRCRGP